MSSVLVSQVLSDRWQVVALQPGGSRDFDDLVAWTVAWVTPGNPRTVPPSGARGAAAIAGAQPNWSVR